MTSSGKWFRFTRYQRTSAYTRLPRNAEPLRELRYKLSTLVSTPRLRRSIRTNHQITSRCEGTLIAMLVNYKDKIRETEGMGMETEARKSRPIATTSELNLAKPTHLRRSCLVRHALLRLAALKSTASSFLYATPIERETSYALSSRILLSNAAQATCYASSTVRFGAIFAIHLSWQCTTCDLRSVGAVPRVNRLVKLLKP